MSCLSLETVELGRLTTESKIDDLVDQLSNSSKTSIQSGEVKLKQHSSCLSINKASKKGYSKGLLTTIMRFKCNTLGFDTSLA